MRRGKTPVLTEEQAHRLLGSLEVVKKTKMRNGTADTGIAT